MTADRWILAIDQGTTSTRAILFDADGRPGEMARRELPQHYPASGHVEHDPETIWEDTLSVCREAIRGQGIGPEELAAVGITNQRETTLLWDRETGEPVHPAIVWQDRRTAGTCRRLAEDGWEDLVRRKTGLLLDPYFSATKLAWLLDEVDGARAAASRGELAFGTVDSWLVWRLTGGRVHATDVSNASRTMLWDIHRREWDHELLDLFEIPRSVLPEVRESAGHFGDVRPDLLGTGVPITGIAGDQQAATFGQAAYRPGMMKGTYGTGAFVLMNTGGTPVDSEHRLLTTVAWTVEGETTYALEGSIFSAGSAVQWLRDGLGIIDAAAETEALAAGAREEPGLYLVPAFTGLGAPHWDADARAALLGVTRDVGPPELARAALSAVAFQTRDLMDAMEADAGTRPVALRVDGGMAANDWAMGFLADMLDLPVDRPEVTETTAMGAAYLAGLAVGLYGDLDELADGWRRERRWEPSMDPGERERRYEGWTEAVERVLTG